MTTIENNQELSPQNGNLLKFSRDLDSDWTVKNNKSQSGGAGEFHPHAPTDPDVTVSRHPALIIQPPG